MLDRLHFRIQICGGQQFLMHPAACDGDVLVSGPVRQSFQDRFHPDHAVLQRI
jgi:hypothetical protein